MPLSGDAGTYITPVHNGALGIEAQPQCKGRPAAAGRVLMRLVMFLPMLNPAQRRDVPD